MFEEDGKMEKGREEERKELEASRGPQVTQSATGNGKSDGALNFCISVKGEGLSLLDIRKR